MQCPSAQRPRRHCAPWHQATRWPACSTRFQHERRTAAPDVLAPNCAKRQGGCMSAVLKTAPGPLLRVDQLVKHFTIKGGLLSREVGRVHAVDGVSFDLATGETLGLVGRSEERRVGEG